MDGAYLMDIILLYPKLIDCRHHPPQPMIPSHQAESIQELVTMLQVLPFYRVVCLSMARPDLSIALPGKESAHTPSSSHNVKMFP